MQAIALCRLFRDSVIQNIRNNHFRDRKKMILFHPHPNQVKERLSDHEDDSVQF